MRRRVSNVGVQNIAQKYQAGMRYANGNWEMYVPLKKYLLQHSCTKWGVMIQLTNMRLIREVASTVKRIAGKVQNWSADYSSQPITVNSDQAAHSDST